MKVAYIISTLGVGGAEVMLVNLVNALPAQVEPVIVALRDITSLSSRLSNPRARVRVVGLENRLDPRSWFRLLSILREERPDIVHSHMLMSNWGARIAGPLSGTWAVINHEHGISRWKGPALRLADKLSQGLARRIVVVSEASRQERLRTTGLDPERVVVIPNAVDVGAFGAVSCKPDSTTPTWGVVARLSPIKRVERALEITAAARRAGHPVRLLVAGDGPERPRLEGTARELGLGDAVEFLGTVRDMIGFYSSIDVFLLTSELEDCPVTILEALACGRFVAATAVGGVPELLREAPDALLISETDPPESVAGILAKVAPGFESGANREHAFRYDISNYVFLVMNLYRDVIDEEPRKRVCHG